MSEPATLAKICLHTERGELNIEIWAKEFPICARFFMQLCISGEYSLFEEIAKKLFIQSKSKGNKSPEKREFNPRIRFGRRGLVCLGNLVENDPKTGDFFITLDAMPELNSKYTIVGKIADNTVFNALRIGDSELVEGEKYKPIYPTIIKRAEIIVEHFSDLKKPESVPAKRKSEAGSKIKPKKKKAVMMTYEDEDNDEDSFSVNLRPAKGLKEARIDTKQRELESKDGSAVEANDLVPENNKEQVTKAEKEIERLRKELKGDEEGFKIEEKPSLVKQQAQKLKEKSQKQMKESASDQEEDEHLDFLEHRLNYD